MPDVSVCAACGGPLDRQRDVALTKDGFDLLRCPACGLLLRGSLPARDDLDEIYATVYFADDAEHRSDGYSHYLADEHLHRDLARRRLAMLDRLAGGARGRLLDVGAAAGFFVDEAWRCGWEAEGIDISSAMVEWGQHHLSVPLEVATLSDVDGGPYAAITMWDYLEHSLDAAGELARCHSLLNPGGLLALSTGDAGSLAARVSGSRWHLLTPRHHNYFFSTQTLRLLLERSGFQVVSASHPGARYSVAHLGYKFERMVRLRPVSVLTQRLRSSRLGRVSVPVNLFDITTMVARCPLEAAP